jgi:high-affinity iron transporter
MVSSFLVLLREGVEAALIVAIVMSCLHRRAAGRGRGFVWAGVGLGVLASLATAAFFHWVVGGFSGRTEEIFEGVLMLAACGVLLYMVVWTAKAARDIKGALTDRVDAALASGQLWSLALLVFFATWREGAETVLFLAALSDSDGLGWLLGAVLGLLAAVAIALAYYRAAGRLNLRRFFQATAILLILMAAGLGAHGVHELQEAGVIPVVREHLYDINPTIRYAPGVAADHSAEMLIQLHPELAEQIGPAGEFASQEVKPYSGHVAARVLAVQNPVVMAFHERGIVGSLATAMFGYNGNPSLIEVVAYILVLSTSIVLFRRFSAAGKGGSQRP